MKNVKLYSNKVNKLKETFFLGNTFVRAIRGKRNRLGIPVVVLDMKTNISSEYKSIAEAARFLDTYPKAIWRKVQSKQLYKRRYLISVKYNDKENKIYYNTNYRLYNIIYTKYTNFYYKVLIDNYIKISYILLFILLGIIMYKYISYIILVFKDTYNNYIFSISKVKVNDLNEVLEDKLSLSNAKQNIFNNTKISLIADKINGLTDFNKKWKSECILKNTSSFITNTISTKLHIYKSIINEINLDFHETKTSSLSVINSSPIIERININNIFSNAIASTNITNDVTSNTLRIQTQGINSNRNYFIVDNVLMGHRPRSTELLNYQSNILYCVINKLSPSIY
jgi:hypothetical protein